MQAKSSKEIEERFKIKRGVNAPLSQQKAMMQARGILFYIKRPLCRTI